MPSKRECGGDSSSSNLADVPMTMQSKPCVECVYNLEEEPGLVCYPSGLRQKCAHCVEKNEQCIRVGLLIFLL